MISFLLDTAVCPAGGRLLRLSARRLSLRVISASISSRVGISSIILSMINSRKSTNGMIIKSKNNIFSNVIYIPRIWLHQLHKQPVVFSQKYIIIISQIKCKKRKKRNKRQRLALPGCRPPSIISANELNFCVRYGNRCVLPAIVTAYFF